MNINDIVDGKSKIGVMKMKKVTGKVTRILSGDTKSGDKFYKVSVEGFDKTLFVWNINLLAGIEVGQTAEFDCESSKKGDFLYVSSSKAIEGTSAGPEAVPENPNASAGPAPKKTAYGNNEYINRMSALKSAVELLTPHVNDMSEPDGDIAWSKVTSLAVAIAADFEKYIVGGYDSEA